MKNWKPVLVPDPVTGELRPYRDPNAPVIKLEDENHDEELCEIYKKKKDIYFAYPDDPMNSAVIDHWAKMGLKKELFDQDHDDGKFGWSLFTPIDIHPDRKYALIYLSHGGLDPINIAETYGFNELAAKERLFICYANNGGPSNDDVDTEFPRIVGEIKRLGYPVDWERVYCVGHSSGSEGTVCAACTNPRLCAAVGVLPGGQPFKDLEFYTGKEYYATTEGLRMPGCFIGGSLDLASYPMPHLAKYPSKPECAKNLDIWLRDIAQIKNSKEVTLDSIIKTLGEDDPVKAQFGLDFDTEYSFSLEGLDWYGGDFYGTDGAPVMRMIRAIGVRHIVWDSQIALAWDYLKHFRRDVDTGESIYDPVACWGEK